MAYIQHLPCMVESARAFLCLCLAGGSAKNPRFLKNYLMLMLAASKILAHFDPDMSLTSVLDQVVDVGPAKRC